MHGWTRLIRAFLPYSTGNNVAAATVALIHPKISKEKDDFHRGMSSVFPEEKMVNFGWKRHKALVGITRYHGSFYAKPDQKWLQYSDLSVKGVELIDQYKELGRGVLVMTYHHHFNILFSSLLARTRSPVDIIAMDESDNTRVQSFLDRVMRIYNNIERSLNGGQIFLVKPNGIMMRPIINAFAENHLVVTANDFPEKFDDKNRMDFPFLNTSLSCPTGTVKLAAKKQIPIVAGYLDWQGGNQFELVISPVSDGNKPVTIEEVMSSYLSVLGSKIKIDPGIWEGWKWLS